MERLRLPSALSQLPGEDRQWYIRFISYCLLGESRSFIEIYRQLYGADKTRVSTHFLKKCHDHMWKDRAARFDQMKIRQLRRKMKEQLNDG
jgi:hypothetical protein